MSKLKVTRKEYRGETVKWLEWIGGKVTAE